MKRLIETPYPPDSPFKPVQDWYVSCMDEDAIEKAGVTPLNATLSLIDAIETPADVNRAIAHFLVWKLPTFMELNTRKDPSNAFAMNALTIDFGGRTLDSLQDYLLPRNAWKRRRLRDYFAELFRLAGYPDGERWCREMRDVVAAKGGR